MRNKPILNLRKSQFSKILNNMEKQIEQTTHLKIKWDEREPVFSGTTVSLNNKPLGIILGKNEFEQLTFIDKVPDNLAAQLLINGFHEQQHVKQRTQMFHMPNPRHKEIYMAINQMVCDNNEGYYNRTWNYYHQPNEIDAEKHGIMNAYHFLSKEYPKLTIPEKDQLFINFINNRTQASSYYIPKKEYTSMREIFKAFDDAFTDSLSYEREYFVGAYNSFDDTAMTYIRNHREIQLQDMFINIHTAQNTGEARDKMIAAITCHVNPSVQKYYPVIVDMD